MGNQGTTKWKLIAFFAISVMLIAGLFTDAAVARDGSGTASVTWTPTPTAGFTTAIGLAATDFRGAHTLYGTFADDDADPLLAAPLPAGSRENQLRLSYFVGVNMAGGQVEFRLPSGWTIHTAAENIKGKDDTGDADSITTGDAYARYGTALLVEIQERFGTTGDGTLIYALNRDGKNAGSDGVALADGSDALTAQKARASVSGSAVTVNLSNSWRSGGELVVVLRNVETAIPRSLPMTTAAGDTVTAAVGLPYANYTVSVKSKRSGRLDTLDPMLIDHDGDDADDDGDDDGSPGTAASAKRRAALPVIRVGNILGLVRGDPHVDDDSADVDSTRDGIQYHGPDRVARNFTITPPTVYQGETNKTFRVMFTAGGPMYALGTAKVVVTVGIPAALQSAAGLTKDNISVITRGPTSPGGRLDEDDLDTAVTDDDAIDQVEIAADNLSVTINLNHINMGGTITLTYELENDDANSGLITLPPAAPGSDPDRSAFTATTNIPTTVDTAVTPADAVDATTVSGGRILRQAGSGTITMDPEQGEAGEDIRKITLTYEAATVLSNVTLEIDVKGIVVEDDDDTDETEQLHDDVANDDDYGYVTHSANFTPTQTIPATQANSGTTIQWSGLSFTKVGQKFVVTIENVRLQEDGASVTFDTRLGPDDTDFTGGGDAAVAATFKLKSPTLYITDPKDDAVEFKINDALFARFSAGEELDKLMFSFEAISTSIKDGQVRFTLPDDWTPAVAPDRAKDQVLDNAGELTISDGGFLRVASGDKSATSVTIRGQTVTVGVPSLAIGSSIKITLNQSKHKTTEIISPVVVQSTATEENKPVKIQGLFWTSGTRGRGYSAGTVDVAIGNVADGYGTATIEPSSIKAGSDTEKITVDYTVPGSMDNGIVRLVIPEHWGNLQDDDATEANYVEVDVTGRGSATANVANRAVEATLTGVVKGSVVTFTYGGGTVASRNGAEVQPRITTPNKPAMFVIETDGDGDGSFAEVKGMQRTKAQKDADKKADNGKPAKPLGAVYATDPGMLFVEVTGASDGSGSAEVAIQNTGQGTGMYPDDDDSDGDRDRTELVSKMRVHAGDTGTYLLFTYTPDETIEDGLLKFQTQGEWSAPQNSPGTPGYTEIEGDGTASLGDVDFDDSDGSVTVEIDDIDPDGTIEIHYGVYSGSDDGSGAVAPSAMATSSAFSISVKGGDGTSNQLKPVKTLKGGAIAIPVYSQVSGGGNVSAMTSDNKGDVGAGDADREVRVVYTAAGQISGGSLKLMIPAGWTHPTMDNVEITSTGTVDLSTALYGGDYIGSDPDDDADDTFPEDADGDPLLGGMDVTVGGVNLDAGQTVTFDYSAAMVQGKTGSPKFNVAVDGGSGPGEGPMAVTPDPADATTIVVGGASPGSGMRSMEIAQAVTINSSGNTLTFIYTATGAITDRRLDIRVDVPAGWSPPTAETTTTARGSFTVTHKKMAADGTLSVQTAAAASIEKIGPFDRQIGARLKHGSTLAAGDQVVFNFENADAPTTIGASTFVMTYGGSEVTMGPALSVLVGSGKPATMLMVTAPAMRLAESTDPARITVQLQDEDGNEAPADSDLAVSLSTSNPSTGSFMVDGAAATMVTIKAGTSTAMAYYTDSSLGEATITASAGTLTPGTATIMVTTEDVEIELVTFAITDSDGVAKTVADVARDGDMITVTATATRGQTAMVTIGTIIPSGGMMTESTTTPGEYTRSHTLVAGSPEGDHAITVSIGDESEPGGSITVDNTAPTVTNASASPDTVENGDTVTISASVTGATSVTANVALLDIGAASVTLADADADGTYTGMHMISADNAAINGAHLITITAMDAAGNSTDATAMVTLKNAISFTSTLPQGISLFSVPLDEEGLDTVGDLETKLGDNVNLLITYDGTSWNSRSSAVAITGSLGILVSMSAETSVTFEGQPWSDTTITVARGNNLIGLPVNDASVTNISDIAGLFATGVVINVIASSGGEFQLVAAAGDPADGPVAGDAAYLVMASGAGTATLSGAGWRTNAVSGAPIALSGYTVDNQTPALNVHGSVVDEITGLTKEGFRVKVKNLSTKSALSHITDEAADGYDMTFVDLADSYAARVGDVLEITADSPDPLIGVQPVRHIVTVDDVKNSRITLEDLIAYEIPAETELLRNYPNPFNPETWIPYHLSEDADVKLTIYDVNGALVRDIDVGHQAAAKYDTRSKAIYWDGRNQSGEQVASGIYFYSLNAGDFSATRKMVILK